MAKHDHASYRLHHSYQDLLAAPAFAQIERFPSQLRALFASPRCTLPTSVPCKLHIEVPVAEMSRVLHRS